MKKAKAVVKATKPTEKEIIQHQSRVALLPSANAAAVIEAFGKGSFGEQDINALIDGLRIKFDDAKNGDLQYCEAMLIGQAHALQSIFVNLARRAVNKESLAQFETFLRMALRAQNQCRATLETLATIKNPPVIFAKQANINHGSGNQQVNNGTPAPASHAEKIINPPNELITEGTHDATLDTRGTAAAIRNNQAMATVEAVNRG